MTTTDTAEALDALAEALLDGDGIAALDPLRPLMAPGLFGGLCERMEVCPVHVRDEQICIDDNDDCPIGETA